MFTNCPDCLRQFRIRASQLAQAEGLVQCGFCGHQFNALERLFDRPIVIPENATEEDALSEPEFIIPELPAQTTNTKQSIETEPEPDFDIPVDLADSEAEMDAESEQEQLAAQQSPSTSAEALDEDHPLLAELAEMEKPKSSIVLRLFWSLGVLLLILTGTAQAAWFNRDILLNRYPQFLPQAKQLCHQFSCTLIRNRDITAITVINRDVRVHPRYEDALLVNATIVNQSKYTQRYPLILLSLFDTNGKVIAYRQVAPTEYLDSSMDIEQGMAANKPVHFVLEVADADIGAVSFEFDFL